MSRKEDTLVQTILSLLRKAGSRGLTKTQLIKLVFFVDLEACRSGSGPITNCSYRTDQYGVVDYGIWSAAEELAEDGIIKRANVRDYHDHTTYRVILASDKYGDTADNIDEITSLVWGRYGDRTAAQLGSITKTLVPMDDEWEIGVAVDPRDIAYEESDEYKKHCEQVLANYPEGHSKVEPIAELLEQDDSCD